MLFWTAGNDVFELVDKVKNSHHLPRLAEANIAICFCDKKAFVRDRFQWGKVNKFSPTAKLWHGKTHFDFLITLSSDAWQSLNDVQKEALIDLHLSCAQVDYMPEMIEENGKKIPVKDELGRISYTNEIKRDDEGNPKWRVDKLDVYSIQENVRRYGCWLQEYMELKSVIESCKQKN